MSTTTTTTNGAGGLTSTTAPGKVFSSRPELAEHYKSEWHRYNLKRREAGLPLLREADFQARLEAALALRKEREGKAERSGTDHLKNNKERKKKQVKAQAAAYERIKQENDNHASGEQEDEEMKNMEEEEETSTTAEAVQEEEPAPVIEPRQCLFDKHMSPSVDANLERMQRKYGFFVPDQEFLVDMEGLLGYCQEKVKLGHYCLYCQRVFSTWQACQQHMISTRHTKLKYEPGIDMEEFEPFYDFTEANEDFLGTKKGMVKHLEEGQEEPMDAQDADGGGWEDVTDDEDEEGADEDMMEEDEDGEGMYAGYQDEIAKYGFDVTPLGELVFPDGRVIGHRGLARYYKQRLNPNQDTAAVVAARRAAGERMYNGRVYNVNRREESKESALALSRAGVSAGATAGQGNGILVPSGGGGFTAVSLYRYRAVVKKARRENARSQRLQNRTKLNINRMDKKANRLFNDQSVAHAKR